MQRPRVADSVAIELAGEQVVLYHDRALIWPARRIAFVADLHLGKSDVFRRAGIAIPEGATLADLNRLTGLVESHQIDTLIVLGDFVHGRTSMGSAHRNHFAAWRERHQALRVVVVEGNHDRHERETRDAWNVEWVCEGFNVGPFVCTHHPRVSDEGYVLSGHVHPVVKLHASSRERTRIPVLCVTHDFAVLPSFGSFTGGAEVELADHQRVYGFAEQRVWKLR
jgi:DNA ligase-associated metallophosphoesterase